METKRAQEPQKTAALSEQAMVSSPRICVDVYTGDTGQRTLSASFAQGPHSYRFPWWERNLPCPVGGEAIVLGLDLLALAVCLRGGRDGSGPSVTGRRCRRDKREEWMGVERPGFA